MINNFNTKLVLIDVIVIEMMVKLNIFQFGILQKKKKQ